MADKKYKLLSGEEIDLETLSKMELAVIKSLEECINDCFNDNKTDYFHVYRAAIGPITTGVGGKSLVRLIDTPFYKVVRDMVTRYGHKCKVFGEEVKSKCQI